MGKVEKVHSNLRLRTINDFLSVAVIVLALYVLAWPHLPNLAWRAKHLSQPTATELNQQAKAETPKISDQNTLSIPRLSLQQPVNEGANISALRNGTWRRPNTSTPEKGGNTVIVGHRLTYDGPAVFYHLDKVQVGDPIVLYWQSKKYEYSVSEIKVVPPSEIAVESGTPDARLTLYTCTPLWSAKDRLVIVAKPTEGE